jgi:hypothetical protein
MRKELFRPYLDYVINCITKASTKEEMLIVWDIIDHFLDRFRGQVPLGELNEAQTSVLNAYQLKNSSETII